MAELIVMPPRTALGTTAINSTTTPPIAKSLDLDLHFLGIMHTPISPDSFEEKVCVL